MHIEYVDLRQLLSVERRGRGVPLPRLGGDPPVRPGPLDLRFVGAGVKLSYGSGSVPSMFAAAAAVLLAAAVAHADTRDDQFLGLLSNDGLNVGPPDQVIALAHQRCDANGLSQQGWFNFRFGGQPSPFNVTISNLNVKLQSHGLTPDQAVQVMRDAVAVYCPDTNG